MTISQGIKMKGRVEDSILTLLEAYSKETGLTVDDIALQVVEEFTIGMREPKLRPVRVTLRVRL